MIDINAVLKTQSFKDACVLTGRNGLTNPVKTITIAEVPDAENWLAGGEIVCTSGFFLNNQTEAEFVEWIDSLIRNKAAALVIKISRFIGSLPDTVIELANKHEFPIINIPNDVSWPNIIEEVFNVINNNNLLQLQHAQRIYEELTQLILAEKDINQLTHCFSNLIGKPIIVEDCRLNLISYAMPDSSEKVGKIQKYIKSRMTENARKKIMHTEFYQKTLTHRTQEWLQMKLPEMDVNTVMVPILAKNTVYGFISLIDAEDFTDKSDFVALEYGANAFALQIMNESNKNIVFEEEQDIIQKLINGYLYPSTISNSSVSMVNWISPMVVVLIKTNIETMNAKGKHPKYVFEGIIKETIQEKFGNCLVGYKDNLFMVLVSLQGFEKKLALVELIEILEKCRDTLFQRFHTHEMSIAVGGIYSSRAKLKKSYEDAVKTLEIMQIIPNLGQIASYEFIGIYRLIHNIGDYEFLKSFRDDYLSDLIEHDIENGDTLCDTLHTYLYFGGNVTLAAKKMFVHPNTIMYRFRKIKGIIGDPLYDAQYRDSLMIALEITKYLKKMEENSY